MSSLFEEELGHSGRSTFYGDKALADWVKMLLWILNGITTIVTICNLLYLKKSFPKVRDIPSKRTLEESISHISHKLIAKPDINEILDITESLDIHNTAINSSPSSRINNNNRAERSNSFIARQSRYRLGIQKYFYVVSIIPCCVSYAGHYGARFPETSRWIFPGMNIAIGIGFLAFIRMMVMSCEGWKELRQELICKPDECESCKTRPMYTKCCKKCCCKPCFLKENAYEGLKQRILFCCLILMKPIVNYIAAIFEIDYNASTQDKQLIAYFMKAMTFFTTFIPLNAMRSFHAQLLPYTRVRRSGIKRTLVGILAPICQIQEMCVQFIWGHWAVPGFGGIDDKYKWCCAYGIILVVEMTFISMIITFVAYKPKDLRLWAYSEGFLHKHGYKNTMKDEEFLFGATGIIDNVDESVPDHAYIADFSLDKSMDSRIMPPSATSPRDRFSINGMGNGGMDLRRANNKKQPLIKH